MQNKKISTVINDEEEIRLRIFSGELPLDEAGHTLLEWRKKRISVLEKELGEARLKIATLRRERAVVAEPPRPSPEDVA